MGVTGFTAELISPISPAKLFKANVVDGHLLSPKVMPEVVVSAAIVEGDGGVGSVRQLNFTSVVPFTFIKERIVVLDTEKLEATLAMFEGGDIGTKLESATCHIKVESGVGGGSVYKVTTEYKSIGEFDYSAEENDAAKNGMIGMFKAIEAYLLANPSYA